MQLPIPSSSRYGIWLRAASASGGKDWRGFFTDSGIHSQWGRTGHIRQSRLLCSRPSYLELQRKIEQKRARGYRLLGEYRPGQGWSHEPSAAAPPTAATGSKPAAPAAAGGLGEADACWF